MHLLITNFTDRTHGELFVFRVNKSVQYIKLISLGRYNVDKRPILY